jgi:hypothetical protein
MRGRTIRRQIEILKYLGIGGGVPHSVQFGENITLYGKPFATVKWDQYDVPTFTFEDPDFECRSLRNQKEAINRDYTNLYYDLSDSERRWLRCISELKSSIISCNLDLPRAIKSLLRKGLIQKKAEKRLHFQECQTDSESTQMYYDWMFELSPDAKGYLKWRDSEEQQAYLMQYGKSVVRIGWVGGRSSRQRQGTLVHEEGNRGGTHIGISKALC